MAATEKKTGRLFIVSGPSGVGKSTICKAVVERTGAMLSVSATTRPKSGQEVEGKDYFFLSKEEFKEKLDRGEFLEHAEVFGNFYGTPKGPIDEALAEGKPVILEIDVQGGSIVKNLYDDAVMIFILPPTQTELAGRINGRGRGEDEETTRQRLEKAGQEIAKAWQFYDHMVINADLEQAVEEVVQIVQEASNENGGDESV